MSNDTTLFPLFVVKYTSKYYDSTMVRPFIHPSNVRQLFHTLASVISLNNCPLGTKLVTIDLIPIIIIKHLPLD